MYYPKEKNIFEVKNVKNDKKIVKNDKKKGEKSVFSQVIL